MHTFTVWKTDTCSFCTQAKGFLDALTKVRDDIQVELRDAHMDPAGFRQSARQVGHSGVPQIYLDGNYIGTWRDLAQAAGSGKLDASLEGRPWETKKAGFFARLFGQR